VLPLRESTIAALDGYLHHPLRPAIVGASTPLFISLRRRRLCTDSFHDTFEEVWAMAAIPGPRPHVHDLRHAFAIRRVAAWYAAGQDVNASLPALSTYLGHVSVENTRLYLVANGALLQAAGARFELSTAALDEVQP
jgi:integrase/recombinase XerD